MRTRSHRALLTLLGALALPLLLGAALTPTSSRHYEVLSDLRGEQFRALAGHMDAVYDEYSRRFAAFDVKEEIPVRLYLFQNRRDYEQTLATKNVNAANTAGMFFARSGGGGGGKGAARETEAGLAAWVGGNDRQRLLQVLQHEGFHQFAFVRISQNLPIWLNEGMAEYFGEGLLIGKRFELGLVPEDRLLRLKQAIRKQQTFPFSQMLSMTHEDWNNRVAADDRRSDLQYDQAWAMVHFLVHAERGKYSQAFERYIRLIGDGVASEQAFAKAFETANPAAFEQAWTRFILQVEPDPVSSAVERLGFLAEGLKALHQRRERPGTIEELKSTLQRAKFRVTITDHASRRTLDSADDKLFQPPHDRGKTTRLDLIPSRDPTLPAELRVSGLRATVILTWSRSPTGEPEPEIVFK